jgi:hypothetical protein
MNRAGVRGEFPDQNGEGGGENDRDDNCDYDFQIIFHGGCLRAMFDLIAQGNHGLYTVPISQEYTPGRWKVSKIRTDAAVRPGFNITSFFMNYYLMRLLPITA